jgi:2-dehydro-3-deoxyphosphogluconate aldolase / (4S)-4-hydroxy-2-oxoglutarate aldolase
MPAPDLTAVHAAQLAAAASDLHEALARHRLVGIIRGSDPQASVATARVLAEEGFHLLEVSLTTTDAFGVLARMAAELPAEVRVGAGTALTPEQVRQAREAGASFVLSPSDCPGLREAAQLGLPTIPGALTPSEVYAASIAPGTAAVKVFPADAHPASYLAALRQPFPGIDLVPVGGVHLADVENYLGQGALAVGVGSPLCGDAPHGGDLDQLRSRARAFVAAAAGMKP